MTAARDVRQGPWLFGRTTDLAAFGGSVALAFAFLAVCRLVGWAPGPVPGWAYVLFVVLFDVGHVWATLFRTYLDGAELSARPVRYAVAPLVTLGALALLWSRGEAVFWRVLAYVAVVHFVRQQVGWVAVYRARAGHRSVVDRLIDDGAVYASTLVPLLHWHAAPADFPFSWFVEGDFVAVPGLAAWLPLADIAWLASLGAFGVRQRVLQRRGAPCHGKVVVVAGTAATWFGGIVLCRSDLEFTVTNVVAHAVPYYVLCFRYARERARESQPGLGGRWVRGLAAGDGAAGVALGVSLYLGLLISLAAGEELAWAWLPAADIGTTWLGWLVPVLATPQVTHYLLDAVLWRRGETQRLPAQRRALGA